MRTPSTHAQNQLQQLVLTSFTPAQQLQQMLMTLGRQNLAFSIDWSGPAQSWAYNFVSRSAAAGMLDAALIDGLATLPNLVARAADLDEIRVLLELKESPTRLVSRSELGTLKQLALDGGLHRGVPFARLNQVTLPMELRQRAARNALDPADQVHAWIDAANRQGPNEGTGNWMAAIYQRGLEEDGVVADPLNRALAVLGGKGLGDDSPVDLAAPGGLERVVRESGIALDAGTFLTKWQEAAARVCGVFIDGQGYGTGFLVGPDLVLTNHHVLASVLGRPATANTVEMRFDFRSDTEAGPAVGLADDWNVDFSPPTAEEKAGKAPPLTTPTPAANLDFALVRLASRVGDTDAPQGGKRGWFTPLKSYAFPVDEALIILGHPNDPKTKALQPQVWSIEPESIIGANETRVRYRTNTLNGSSGSPVFTLDWDLVALHHYGATHQYNQGIPFAALFGRRGFDKALNPG